MSEIPEVEKLAAAFIAVPVSIAIPAAGEGTRTKSKLSEVLHRSGGRALPAHVIDRPVRAWRAVVTKDHGAIEVEAACSGIQTASLR